jgi:hypothetical protein
MKMKIFIRLKTVSSFDSGRGGKKVTSIVGKIVMDKEAAM